MQKIVAKTDMKELTTYIFSGSFIVLGLKFRSLIHFELAFGEEVCLKLLVSRFIQLLLPTCTVSL